MCLMLDPFFLGGGHFLRYSDVSCSYCSQIVQFTVATQTNNGNIEEAGDHHELEPMHTRQREQSTAMSLNDRMLYANIRTAAMLFVVTVVFLFAFLPAWLMAHHVVPFNEIIFYMYFIYNTANPFIYAFMKKSFRDDLRKILKVA